MRVVAFPPVPDTVEAAFQFLRHRGLDVATAGEDDALDDPALGARCDVVAVEATQAVSILPALRASAVSAALPVAVWAEGPAGLEALEAGADLWLDPREPPSNLALRLAALVRRASLGGAPRVDSLTGLINHRRFADLLRHEFDRASRYRRAVGLLVIEPDRFDELNRDVGRAAGDAVLRELSERLRGLVRDVDLLARLSGKRFAALLPETDAGGALAAAERLRGAIDGSLFRVPGPGSRRKAPPLRLSVSVGVAAFPSRGMEGSDDLLGRALESLTHAQKRGGNRVVAFGASDVIWSREAPDPATL